MCTPGQYIREFNKWMELNKDFLLNVYAIYLRENGLIEENYAFKEFCADLFTKTDHSK